jgi:hypothetical protein
MENTGHGPDVRLKFNGWPGLGRPALNRKRDQIETGIAVLESRAHQRPCLGAS